VLKILNCILKTFSSDLAWKAIVMSDILWFSSVSNIKLGYNRFLSQLFIMQ
jgi:hypothetical protein